MTLHAGRNTVRVPQESRKFDEGHLHCTESHVWKAVMVLTSHTFLKEEYEKG